MNHVNHLLQLITSNFTSDTVTSAASHLSSESVSDTGLGVDTVFGWFFKDKCYK